MAATGRYKLLSSDAGKRLKNIITLMPFVGRLRSQVVTISSKIHSRAHLTCSGESERHIQHCWYYLQSFTATATNVSSWGVFLAIVVFQLPTDTRFLQVWCHASDLDWAGEAIVVITTIVNIPELKPFLQWALLFFGVQDMQVDVIRYLQQVKEKVNHVLDLH